MVDAGLAGDGGHQLRGQSGLPVVRPAQFTQERPVDFVEVGARFAGRDQLAHLGANLALVDLPFQQSELLRTLRDRALRHVGFLIPLQQADDMLRQVDLPVERAEAFQWIGRGAVVAHGLDQLLVSTRT